MSDIDLMPPRTLDLQAEVMEAPPGNQLMVIQAGNQFVTARRVEVYRNEVKVLEKIGVAAMRAGDDWYYSWPTKNKDGTVGTVEGLGIKGAMAVARYYGNCHVGVTEVQESPTHWVVKAAFVDLENGFTVERAFRQRRNQRAGKQMEADRAEDIAFQIGTSKAMRNAVNNGLEEFTLHALEMAKRSLVERVGKNLEGNRGKVLARLSELKIDPKRLQAVTGKSPDQWLARDVAGIIANLQSIFEGMASADDIWPAIVEAPSRGPTADATGETATDSASAGTVMPDETATSPQVKPPASTKPPKAAKPAAAKATIPPPSPAVEEVTEEGGGEDQDTGQEQGDVAQSEPAADDDFPGDRKTSGGSMPDIPAHLDRRNPNNIADRPSPTSPPPAAAKPKPAGLFRDKE